MHTVSSILCWRLTTLRCVVSPKCSPAPRHTIVHRPLVACSETRSSLFLALLVDWTVLGYLIQRYIRWRRLQTSQRRIKEEENSLTTRPRLHSTCSHTKINWHSCPAAWVTIETDKLFVAHFKTPAAIVPAPPSEMAEENYQATTYRNCNQVAQERIWKENVHKEQQAAKVWWVFPFSWFLVYLNMWLAMYIHVYSFFLIMITAIELCWLKFYISYTVQIIFTGRRIVPSWLNMTLK